MKAHMPWGHPGYTMTVTFTRDEVIAVTKALGELEPETIDDPLDVLYTVMQDELEDVLKVEAAFHHEVDVAFVTMVDHHGQASGRLAYCKECDKEVAQMKAGNYKHKHEVS